jgi:DNA-binding MarR family transcriptional regulator
VYASNVEQFRNGKIDMSNENREELVARVGQEVFEFQNAADAVDDAVAWVLGLNPTDQRCLALLVMRGPMTAGRLADRAYISAGAMTVSLDRLERAGFVRRVRDEDDRRRVVVEATPEARRRAWELYQPLVDEGMVQLGDYSDEQLRKLVDFLRASSELQVAYAERLRRLAPRAGPVAAIRAAVKQAKWELKAELKGAKADLKAELKAAFDPRRRPTPDEPVSRPPRARRGSSSASTSRSSPEGSPRSSPSG